MIKVKLKDWVEVYGLKNTSTTWKLATDPDFNNVIYSITDKVHLSYFSYDLDVPLGVTYYLKAIRELNNGESEVTSQTIAIEADNNVRDNVILEKDLLIDEPSVYVNIEQINNDDIINVSCSDFRANGDQHAYTHWTMEDANGKILWKSLYDRSNLTSIDIPNLGQPYSVKSKLVFRAVHGSKVGMESKIGNFTVFIKNVNFEIIGELSQVKPLKDLVLTFKKIKANKRLGISYVEIIDDSTEAIMKKYTDFGDKLTINWWMLRYGVKLKMRIHCLDNYDNLTTINKFITVSKYGNDIVKDENYKYSKEFDNFFSSDYNITPDFYIPNNFTSEPMHNGYMGIPKRGKDKTKIYAYDLVEDGRLILKEEMTNIEILGDETKEGMLIKRVNDDLLMISHTRTGDDNIAKHEMLFYKHQPVDGKYRLLKQFYVNEEVLGLGYNNSVVQIDAKTLIYVVPKTDSMKKIDLDMFTIEYITKDIPYIETKDEAAKDRIISPTAVRLDNGRILLAGGYSNNTAMYDPWTNKFQESIVWEQETYMANPLVAMPLINGDSIIMKKENATRSMADRIANINNVKNNIVVESLREVYDNVNKDKNMGETIFKTDLNKYEILTGINLEITLSNNFEDNTDIRQYYIVYDSNVFRLDTRTTDKLIFHVLTHSDPGEYGIKLVASKDQLFDQNTYYHTKSFTNKVVEIDLIINVEDKDKQEVTEDETGTVIGYYKDFDLTESEHLYILGNKINYKSENIYLKCYKEDILKLPIEIINLRFEDLEFKYDNNIKGKLTLNINKRIDTMFTIEISNILVDENFVITIANKLKNAEFTTIYFEFIETPVKGLPKKAKLIRNNVEYDNYETLSFFDLTRYNLSITDNIKSPNVVLNNDKFGTMVSGSSKFEYLLNLQKKGLSLLFINHPGYPSDVYNNTFYYINSVDAVPNLPIANPNVILKLGNTITAKLLNSYNGYDPNSEKDGINITIEQNNLSKNLALVTYINNNLTIVTNDKLGSGVFKINVTNKADKAYKSSTFNFTIYEEDSYPIGLTCMLPGSKTGGNNEKIFLLPGSNNKVEYIETGNKVAFDLPRGSIFNVDITNNSLTKEPVLSLISNRDLGKDTAFFKYFNSSNIAIASLQKNIVMVPVVFYVRDTFLGDILVDNYEFKLENGSEERFKIIPKMNKGYRVVTIKITPNKTYLDTKFYIEKIEDDPDNAYLFVISNNKSEDDKTYSFRIEYTYVNEGPNDILMVTEEYQQNIIVNSTYYKPKAYVNTTPTKFTLQEKEMKKLSITTNADNVKITSLTPALLSVDNKDNSVTGIKAGEASVLIEAGGPNFVHNQETIYIDVITPKPEVQKPQGELEMIPEEVKLFVGTKFKPSFTTTADKLDITMEDPTIASYDDITKDIVGKKIGITRLKAKFSGNKILGGTKYFTIKVLEKPDRDPDILYYDSFNHELTKTNAYFTTVWFSSLIMSASGKVIVANYTKIKKKDKDEFIYRTYYTLFK